MSKKLIVILINFIVILVVALIIAGQVDEWKGLKEVYVAKSIIKKGVKITPEMIEKRKVTLNKEGKGQNSKDRVTYYDDVIIQSKDVVGQYALYDIIPGEVIIKDKLASKVNTTEQYMFKLPKGYFAYTIANTIPGGLVKLNDYIDLYIYGKNEATVIDEPVLRHLRVYDLRADDGTSLSGSVAKDNNGEVKQAKYIVVALNDFQIKKLIDYEMKGAVIKAALRKRPNSEYEVYDYPELVYPSFAISPEQIIDEAQEQQLIDANKVKLDNELFEKDNLSAEKPKATNTTNTTNSTTNTNNLNSSNP